MTMKHAMFVAILLALSSAVASQGPAAGGAPTSGTLRQIIPGHHVYTQNNAGRLFNSGVVAASDGVLVFDALDSEALARSERQAIARVTTQPIRYLVSSPFHDPFSKGNIAYGDVFKIGHENYRAGLIDQMQRGNLLADEQRVRMPNATYRDRMSFFLGGKDIQLLYLGAAHTKGDSILFVPQDRIVYMSEVFFNEEFPNMAGGYGVSWIKVLDAVRALDADIFIPGHGPIPDDPKQTRAALDRMRQLLVDVRDRIQNEMTRGATEDQVVATVTLQQYEKMPQFAGTREAVVRRMYKELKGTLP